MNKERFDSPSTKCVKKALIRAEGVPIGEIAEMHVNCSCGPARVNYYLVDAKKFKVRHVRRYDGDETYYECRECKVWHRIACDSKHDAQCLLYGTDEPLVLIEVCESVAEELERLFETPSNLGQGIGERLIRVHARLCAAIKAAKTTK